MNRDERITSPTYEFGPFQIDVGQRRLSKNEREVSLTPKAFDLLLALVKNNGQLLSRTDLLKILWPDVYIETCNLTQTVFALRQALGEKHGTHQYIQTVPKYGYRFIASVKNQVPGAKPKLHKPRDPMSRISLAILPFVNEASNPEIDYLCEGLTETLIKNLSPLQNLDLKAHSSVLRYRKQIPNLRAIRRDLSVSIVLIGRITVRGEQVVVNTELVDTVHERQLWSERYERRFSRLTELQQGLANDITDQLGVKLSKKERSLLSKRYTDNIEAYRLYLKGRFYWNKYKVQSMLQAIEYFEQAIQLDSNYALAYAGMADAYFRLSTNYLFPSETIPKAEAAVKKALSIDPALAEAHASLGILKLRYEWNGDAADKEFKKAISLNPGYATAHHWYSHYFVAQCKFDEAFQHLRIALDLDPLSMQIPLSWGTALWKMRRFDAALEKYREVVAMDPTYYPARTSLAVVLGDSGKFDESLAEFSKLGALGESGLVSAFYGYVLGIAGRRSEARRILREVTTERTKKYVPAYGVALLYVGLHQPDAAFKWLEISYRERDELLTWLASDPRFDILRSDPRYKELIRRVGLCKSA